MAFINDLYLSRKPLAAFAIIGLGWATYFAQMPVIKQNLNVSDADYGLLVFLSSLGAVGAMFLSPWIANVFGRFALVAGAMAVCLGFVWVGATLHPISFLFGLTLAAAGTGIIDVLANARISAIEAQNQRALMNLNHGFYSFCYAGAAVLTGAARDASWSPLNVFVALTLVICALSFVMYDRDSEYKEKDTKQEAGKLSMTLVWIVGAIIMMAFLTESVTEGWSALHIERTLGGGASQGAFGPAILGLMMGIGRLGGHLVSKYISELRLITLASVLSAFGVALAAGATSVGAAYLGFALGGLGISVVGPSALALLGRLVPPNMRTVAISRAAVIGNCAFFAGPGLMGFVSQGFGLATSFYVIAGLVIAAVVTLVPLLARQVRAAV